MSRKNVVPYHLLRSQSLASSFTSPVTTVNYMDNISYEIDIITTDSVGSFAVEVSNSYQVDNTTGTVINAGTWAQLNLGGTPVVNATNDSIIINLNQIPYNAVRLSYTANTPGTGTCEAYLLARQIGG